MSQLAANHTSLQNDEKEPYKYRSDRSASAWPIRWETCLYLCRGTPHQAILLDRGRQPSVQEQENSHSGQLTERLAIPEKTSRPFARLLPKKGSDYDYRAPTRACSGRIPRICRASEAPVSARAVAVIRPVPIIIALYPVPLHPVWQTPVARFSVSVPLFRPHLATKHAIHKNEVAESEAHPQRPPNKPHS